MRPRPPPNGGSGSNGKSTRRRSTVLSDLRNARFKLAPVDTNLFPGGFNNLSQEVLPLAVQAAMASIEKMICPDAKNLLVIPERHTRNAYYLENVARLVLIASGGAKRPFRHAR